MEVMGQFVTAQKTPTRPRAAPNAGLRPKSALAVAPKVAPIKKEGKISPPLNPAPMVSAVNTIFKAKNLFGWKDVQETVIVKHEDSLGDVQSAEQLAQKYQTALPKEIDVEYREVAEE